VQVEVPGVGAHVEAFILRDQADMREADLRFVAILRDVEKDFGTLPFTLILGEVEMVVYDKPRHPLLRDERRHSDLALVDVLVAVSELIIECVRIAFDIFGPPPPNVGDCNEDLFWGLVYG
jgi:hypothetical protein